MEQTPHSHTNKPTPCSHTAAPQPKPNCSPRWSFSWAPANSCTQILVPCTSTLLGWGHTEKFMQECPVPLNHPKSHEQPVPVCVQHFKAINIQQANNCFLSRVLSKTPLLCHCSFLHLLPPAFQTFSFREMSVETFKAGNELLKLFNRVLNELLKFWLKGFPAQGWGMSQQQLSSIPDNWWWGCGASLEKPLSIFGAFRAPDKKPTLLAREPLILLTSQVKVLP